MIELTKPLGKAARFEKLIAVEKDLNDRFKTTNSIVRLGKKVGVPIPSIATGLPNFDWNGIQTGGIPRGRIIEIFGPESSGKTSISLHITAQEQKNDGIVAYVDAEHALDPTYAKKLGVNVDELLVSQPDNGEQALEIVASLTESGLVSLIIVDSVAALVPQAELDGEMGDAHVGLQARLMSQAMRKLTGMAAKNGVTIIFINQIREKIGVMFGSRETTSGGRALKFYSSVRLDVRRKEAIKEGDKVIGHDIKIRIVKNKVGVPFREVIVTLMYDTGIDTAKDIIDFCVESGIIEKSGGWLKFKGKSYHQADLLEECFTELKEKVNEYISKRNKSEIA